MKQTALILALAATPLAAQNARPSVVVDALNPDVAIAPAIDTDGGLTVAIYKNDTNEQILASVSDAAGQAWSTPVRIDDDATGANKFVSEWSVHVSGTNVIAAWRDERNGSTNDDVYFTVSTDGGATFGPNQRVDVGVAIGTGVVRDWRLAVTEGGSGTNVFFLVNQEPAGGGSEELFFVANDPTVALDSFNSAVYLPSWPAQSFDVDNIGLTAEGDNVYVGWDDNQFGQDDVFFRASNDRGATFGAELQLDTDVANPLSDTEGEGINLSAVGSTVAVAWHQENTGSGPEGLRVAVSTDGGASFGTDVGVGMYVDGTDDVDRQAIAVDPTNPTDIVVVWVDDRAGQNGVYTATSTDSGLTWGADTTLGADANFPRLRFGSDGIAGVLFSNDNGAGDDAALAYSDDCGATWTTIVADDNAGDVDFAELAYDEGLENFIAVYLSDDSGTNDVYAGGFSVCVASNTDRNAGTNPNVYTATDSILGGTFTATIDASVTGHGLVGLVGYNTPFTFTLGGGQTLLVNPADPGGELLGQGLAAGPLAVFNLAVPNDPTLCSFALSTQGVLVTGVTPFALTNAIDVVVGAR